MQLIVDSCSQDLSGGQSLSSTYREWKLEVVTVTEKNISHLILSAVHLPASFLVNQNKAFDPHTACVLLCDVDPYTVQGDG